MPARRSYIGCGPCGVKERFALTNMTPVLFAIAAVLLFSFAGDSLSDAADPLQEIKLTYEPADRRRSAAGERAS